MKEEQNNTILYLDYWTVGINNFKAFDQLLKDKGFETKLFHFSSWRGLEDKPYQEIKGIPCFEIKYYKTNFIYKVLEKEQPLAVVLLNASYITDRTVILACKKLGIKIVYLMHGTEVREEQIDAVVESKNKTLKKIRAINHFRGTIQNYLYSILKYNKKYFFNLYAFKVLFRTLINPAKYLLFPPPSFDLHPDLVLAYGPLEEDFCKKRYASTIKVIGNPELDEFFLSLNSLPLEKDLFYKANKIPLDQPTITYIDEGLAESRTWDNEYRINFYQEINRICSENGYHLVIKLHPRTSNGPYRKSFDLLENVTVLDQVDFPKLVYFSDKCISHFSTTLVYPILLNKPILVPRWGKSADLPVMYRDKEVKYVRSIEDFSESLRDDQTEYDRSEYLREYVPFTDGKTRDRIAQYIIDIVK